MNTVTTNKILYIVPHLSTGGLPQYVYKQIQHFNEEFEIEVVEINNVGGEQFAVQKNKIRTLVPLHTLGNNKEEIISIIEKFSPHIIHFQEIPQFDLSFDILNKIFDNSRNYFIVVTTHGSYTDPTQIKYHPDRYVLVNEWSKSKFETTGVETTIWDYPIEAHIFDKTEARQKLGFDSDWKHVLNVGLFTDGKNQKELFQIAERLKEYKIKFHFVGNQAVNFQQYWQPLMDTKPTNCIIWGERDDVDDFYKAADMFYFPSIVELNPISIKEALSYKLPSLFRRLEVYGNTYDGVENVYYINNDINYNEYKILKILGLLDIAKTDELSVILAYPDTEYRKTLLKKCVNSISGEKLISTHYPIEYDIHSEVDWILYDKTNPLLYKSDFKKYNVYYEYWKIDESGNHIVKDFDYEHSYAVYTLIRNSLKYAQSIGKKYIHLINYDYELSDKILEGHMDDLIMGYDVVFYKYENNSYSTGVFSGEINSLLNYFDKYKNIEEFYRESNEYVVMEDKVYNYYNENKIMIKELLFKNLENIAKVNQEGLLEFSKTQN